MTKSDLAKNPDIAPLLDRYRVTDGAKFRLEDYDPSDTGGLKLGHAEAESLLAAGIGRLAEMQEKLYAQDRFAFVLALQAMDAAGKDGTIKHVLSGVNPQGITVTSFKAPEPTELDHDFLWRVHRALPRRGRIGILNRSHYEEVLVVRVHPEILAHQRLPIVDRVVDEHFWHERLHDIAAFEHYLARQGTVMLKVFLDISKSEQKRRLLDRLKDPEKHWKFDPSDLAERAYWDDYRRAYQDAIAATATPHAPWLIVPANHKWFARLIVAAAIVERLESLDLAYPSLDDAARHKLKDARKQLKGEH